MSLIAPAKIPGCPPRDLLSVFLCRGGFAVLHRPCARAIENRFGRKQKRDFIRTIGGLISSPLPWSTAFEACRTVVRPLHRTLQKKKEISDEIMFS